MFDLHYKIEKYRDLGFIDQEESCLVLSSKGVHALATDIAENLYVIWLTETDKSLKSLAEKFSLPLTIVIATFCTYDFFIKSPDTSSIEQDEITSSTDLNLRLAAYVASKRLLRASLFSDKPVLKTQDLLKILDRQTSVTETQPTEQPKLTLSPEDRKALLSLVEGDN